MVAEMHVGILVKCPHLMSNINQYQNVDKSLLKPKILHFIKLLSAILGLSHADTRTDRYGESNSKFLQVLASNSPTNGVIADTGVFLD